MPARSFRSEAAMPTISSQRTSIVTSLLRRLNLRFPTLVFLLGALTMLDIAIPDLIPFVDEIALACLTLLAGSWKNRGTSSPPDIAE
jgi:hypothetical protein